MITATKITYDKYPAYKDSGVEWLGEIPEHWEVMKIKFYCDIYSGDSLNESKKKAFESQNPNYLPYVSSRDIDLNFSTISYDSGLRIPKGKGFKIAEKNSALLCIEGGSAGRKIGYTNQEVTFVNKLACFKSNNNVKSKFIFYFLRGLVFQTQFFSALTGLIGGVSISNIRNFDLVIPPLSEQQKIAEFLDEKTEKIDRAIAQKEKMIALLKERKQIIIQDLVTGKKVWNADKNTWTSPEKTKDSGVEWIGEIPENWEVLPGLIFFRENKRSNKGMKESRVLSLSYGNIIIRPVEKLVGLVPESFETYQIVNPGDIIIRCTDLQNDQTSLRTGISNDNGIITSAYINLGVIGENLPEYLHYYLHFIDISKVLYKFGSGLRQNLSFSDFKRMPIIRVPLSEQLEIVKIINEISTKIDKAIDLQAQQIEKLKELKSTLIDSAVTGKLRVPALQEIKVSDYAE